MRRLPLPDRIRNPLSFPGLAIATAMAIVFLVLVLREVGGFRTNPATVHTNAVFCVPGRSLGS